MEGSIETFDKESSTSGAIMNAYEDVLDAEAGVCQTMGIIEEHTLLKVSSTGYIYKAYSTLLIVRKVL